MFVLAQISGLILKTEEGEREMARLMGQQQPFYPSQNQNQNQNQNQKPSRRRIKAVLEPSPPKARFVARRRERVEVEQRHRPLVEYMRLPASQYSVLDAERIERVDDDTFRCFVQGFNFINLKVCPVLLVRVQPHPLGCSINLISCHLQGSPIVVAQNHKFHASMLNHISCDPNLTTSQPQRLTSDAVIQVTVDVPFPFRAIPIHFIESTGTQLLHQILRIMLPRFLQQLVKDYEAWASGDTSRQPLGTGQL